MFSAILNGLSRLTRASNNAPASALLLDLSYGRYFATKTTAGKKVVKKTTGSKKTAKTVKKVSAKPKKPEKLKQVPSAFNLYVKDQFHKQKKGDEKAPEIMKILAVAWKKLAALEKQPFEQQANKLKVEKEKMMQQRKANRGPPSAYIQFVKDNYSKVKGQNPQLRPTQMISQLAGMWKSLPQTEKDTRMKNAENAKQQFLKKKSTA